MDTGPYRQVLQECFPDLTVSHIRFIGGGTFRVFEVADARCRNTGMIFRFPHGGEGGEMLRRERRVCEHLRPVLPLPIPRYAYYSEDCPPFPGPIAGYRKLDGVALQDCAFDPATLRWVAVQLGRFLSALHGAPPEVVAAARVPAFTPAELRERQRAFYGQVREQAFPLLAVEEQAWTKALFEPFLAGDANWRFETALVHGDFDASNILCDPGEGRVTGIIDFEEASLSDPAWDFCVLAAEYGQGFLQDVVAAYRLPLDPSFTRRVAFHERRILFHELLYGIQAGEERFVEHGQRRLQRATAGLEPIGGWLAASTSETRREAGFPV